MSNIITPNSSVAEQNASSQKIAERREKEFQLMLHMHIQPSELERMSEEKLDWILKRFMYEVHSQQEMLAQQQLASQLKL